MNKYGNEIGFHNTILTAKIAEQLKERLPEVEFLDSSWHNDLVDSLAIEKLDIMIYLPNNEEIQDEDEEMWKTYNINGLSDCWDESKELQNIEQVVEFIKKKLK